VAITVGDLLELGHLNLRVVGGEAGLDRPIRWVHTSELQDPTPWLSGGELLLTTGMGLQGSQALQRTFVRKLVDAGLSGLGFGVGFGFTEVPAPIRRAADRAGFPVIEVPYPVPFIAIAEAVSSHIAEERVREAQTSIEVHERLASLMSTGAGPADVLDEVTAEPPRQPRCGRAFPEGWSSEGDPSLPRRSRRKERWSQWPSSRASAMKVCSCTGQPSGSTRVLGSSSGTPSRCWAYCSRRGERSWRRNDGSRAIS
jgi:hypothetical protein